MNLTCFYCQTPFTLSMDQKIAALRKMHAEDLHHYDAHCPRCGRANAISRERLEMFTPGWEEAIKEPAMSTPGLNMPAAPSGTPSPMMVPSPVATERKQEPEKAPAMKKPGSAPARRRHAPAAKKAAKKATKKVAKKAPAKKKVTAKKKTAPKAKKTASKAKGKSTGSKTAKKTKRR
jgi:hypothetical protein